MKAVIAKKISMTQVFNEAGEVLPVTVLQVEKAVMLERKEKEKHRYDALKVGYGNVKENKLPKALRQYFHKLGVPPKRRIVELRDFDSSIAFSPGKEIGLEILEGVEKVDVQGYTKGKGFQGVMRRHGFHGGPSAHGSKFHRAPGSIGACADPGRVWKGQKLPGRMGNRKKTVKNLQVVSIDIENQLLLVKGAVPGPKKQYLIVKAR